MPIQRGMRQVEPREGHREEEEAVPEGETSLAYDGRQEVAQAPGGELRGHGSGWGQGALDKEASTSRIQSWKVVRTFRKEHLSQ